MAGLWDVLIPAAGTNLIKNPSFELGSIWRDATYAGANVFTRTAGGYFGAYYLHVEGILGGETTWYQPVTLTSGVSYTLSAYTRSFAADGAIYVGLSAVSSSDVPLYANVDLNASSDWTRSQSTYSATDDAVYYLQIYSEGVCLLDIDGIQLEASSTATAYIDGDQPGCVWNGPPVVSTSSRRVTSRAAGVWTDWTDLGVYVTTVNGLGIGDQEIAMSEFALRDGGEVRQTRTPSRNFSLAFDIVGSSQSDLHTKRRAFENYLYARRYGSSQPVYLRYRGAASNVIVKCWYEGGLSYNHGGGQGFTERTAARFILEDATMSTETVSGFVPTESATIGGAAEYNLLGLNNGINWTETGTGVSGPVYALEYTPQGLLYIGGLYATASTSGLTVNNISSFDGDTFYVVSDSGVNGTVWALKSTPNGAVYMGGAFTALTAGTEMRRVSVIDPAADTAWPTTTITALGAGFTDGVVYAVEYASTSEVYAGGTFTSDSDATALARVAKFDGDTWAQVGAGFSDGAVYALTIGADGPLYAAGTMTTDTDSGAFPNHLASFTSGDTAWVAIGPELTDTSAKTFRALAATPGGLVYAGGYIDTLTKGYLVAIRNGSAELISDTVLPIYSLRYDKSKGLLYIGHGSGGVSTYNGGDIQQLDVISSGASIFYALAVYGDVVQVGGDIDEAVTAGASNTVTVSGSGAVQPVLYLLGGTLRNLRNHTTGDDVYFNITCQTGEIIKIDFASGSIVSSYGRNLYSGVIGGDFSTFRLVPGDNTVIIYATGSAESYLSWTEREIGL